MKTNRCRYSILLAVAAAGIFLILDKVQIPSDTHLWRAISNAGHMPLFGTLALIMLGLSGNLFGSRIRHWYVHYLLALAATLVMGAASEYMQISSSRDADIWDFFRDFGGAVAFLGLFALSTPRMAAVRERWNRASKTAILLGTLSILAAGVTPLALWTVAYTYRDIAFPQICGFGSFWESKFYKTKQADLIVTAPPRAWGKPGDDRVGKVTFQPVEYSEFILTEPPPDWSKSEYFVFEIYSELYTDVFLGLRIEDSQHNNQYDDRFNHRITISPGINQIIIPLEIVEQAPRLRLMDMSAIRRVSLFAHEPPDSFTVFMDSFELR